MRKELSGVLLWWNEWDWRPLARLSAWAALGLTRVHGAHVDLLAVFGHALEGFLLLSIVTFGVLTHLLLIAAMVALRLALAFDKAAYAVSERLIRPAIGRASFAATFFAAFSFQLMLVFGSVELWHAAHLGGRLLSLLAEVTR